MSKGVGQPGYRVRYRPGEVRSSRRGRRIRGFQEFFVGVTRAAYWLGLLALLVYAGYQSWYLLTQTSYFKVEEVEIAGNQVLTKDDVLSLSKIELGSHFFRYQPENIRASLLAHPRIREAKVEQVSPKKIAISVVENQPVVRTLIEGKPFEVGEDGRVLGAAESPATTLPLLVGLPEDAPDAHGTRRIAADVFSQVPAWVTALRGSFLSDFEAVDFRNPYRIEVRWRGMQIFVSEPQDIRSMAPHVQATLADAEKRHVKIAAMDLRFGMLVVKYGSAALTPVATWAAPAIAETVPLTTPPTIVTTSTQVVFTEHPALKAAQSTPASTGVEAITSASAMWDESELKALNETPVVTAPAAAPKPEFQADDEEGEDAPDPAYIYNPTSVRRRALEPIEEVEELDEADGEAPDYRIRPRRVR